jgi:hypothetical protein
MGQKNHPLSLRIQSSTRSFDKSWYSDHFFTKLVSVDIYLSKYLNTFFKLLQLPFARFSIHHYPKTTELYTFFCYPRQSREYKSKIFQIPTGLTSLSLKKQKSYQTINLRKQQLLFKNSINDYALLENLLNPSTFHFVNSHEKWLFSQFNKNFLRKKHNLHENLQSPNNESLFHEINRFILQSNHETSFNAIKLKSIDLSCKAILKSHDINLVTNQEILKKFLPIQSENIAFPLKFKDLSGETTFDNLKQFIINLYMLTKKSINQKNIHFKQELKYKNHLQNYISQILKFNLKIIPFKVNQEWQDAGYFADEIVYLLERRIPFRQLKNRILKQLASNANIKGLRLTCSGRVGGKSKKAQRAKIDSIKHGQTSLHVFSSKIDFAVRTAHTPLGSTGIKLWICYK